MAVATFIIEPSPLTIIIGASIPISSSAFLTDAIRSMIVGISPALIIAVLVRLSNPNFEVRSWAHTTGMPRILFAMDLTVSSWLGFLTLMYPATARTSIFPRIDSRAALTSFGISRLTVLPFRSSSAPR